MKEVQEKKTYVYIFPFRITYIVIILMGGISCEKELNQLQLLKRKYFKVSTFGLQDENIDMMHTILIALEEKKRRLKQQQ